MPMTLTPVRTLVAAAALAFTALSAQAAPLESGIELKDGDPSVRVQDDLFRNVNGAWLKDTPIPADRAQISAFQTISDRIQGELRELIESPATQAKSADSRKVADVYASFMDEAALEKLGAGPLAADLAAIDALADKKQLVALMARMVRGGVPMPIVTQVHHDAKDSSIYAFDLGQGGLGLPDRDYYLKDDDRFKLVRKEYLAYVAKLFALAGINDGDKQAQAILDLETDLARVQWTRVENRDPVKGYNPMRIEALATLAPGFDWATFTAGIGVAGKVPTIVVSQPSYLTGLAKTVDSVPLDTWKSYARLRVIGSYAPYLSKDFVDARFAFGGTVLRGTPENEPRWKRGVTLVQGTLGEGLGRLYVAQYFPPAYKARVEKLVASLLAAYKQSINTLDWMGPATKKEAQAKLATFRPKIGYPVKWIDYSALDIKRDDLVGNVRRGREFDYDRDLVKLGRPIDRDEWFITPQTVNAYYDPESNEVVFPAAILQPPFFNPKADDAVNYGAIGAVIGHEISHGFDDQGSQYDGAGNLRDWWTAEDREKFKAKASMLVEQYSAFSPVPGYHVNGELTLGENIADNSGLAIAYKAYHLSLKGRKAPVIDGLTGDARFFKGFGQVWRGKTRDAMAIERVKTDPHSPPELRANGTARNHPGFYTTFGVKPGDGMYLPPDKRVLMW